MTTILIHHIKTMMACCLALLISTDVVGQTSKMMTQEQMLATSLPTDEVLWLEAKSGKFLALQRPYMNPTKRGIAILISDINTPLNNPNAIESLRHSLNDVGWSTLSIMPPDNSLLSISDKEKPLPYASELIERLNSAITWGNKEHKHNVVIVQGREMAYLIDAIVSQHLLPIGAIVLLDAQSAYQHDTSKPQQFPSDEKQLAQQLSELTVPILDIYQQQRSELHQHAMLRGQMAKKNKAMYRQIEFSAKHNNALLNKTIYGWLSNHHKSMMKKAAKKK